MITTLLEHVIARPTMYIGELNLYGFECFICGYFCGQPKEREKWTAFNDWVITKHYRRTLSNLRCTSIIAIKFGWKKRGMLELIRLWKVYNNQ